MLKPSNADTIRTARRLVCCAVGAALLSIPTLAFAQDPNPEETFVLQSTVTIPGQPLTSFDIGWVDPALHKYFLADRSNAGIDIIDTRSKDVTQIIPQPPVVFVGNTGTSVTSGPNGILTIDDQPGGPQIWAGDGDSTVKIISYPSGQVLNVVDTGGQQRADELCYDPRDKLVLMANDGDPDLFVTFIQVTPADVSAQGNNPIVGRIRFNGTDPNANFLKSTGGIEQCQWNPRVGLFYLNIPSTTQDPQGDVVTIDPLALAVVNVLPAGSAAENCQPTGMAIGPAPDILLACGANANNVSLVMNDAGGTAEIPGNSGADEVWFNPGDNHYFLAESNNPNGPQLGIVDALTDAPDQNIPGTGASSHSVAADPEANQAYVPIKGGAARICGTFSGNAADDAKGCVAIFGPSGPDDPANSMVFISRN